MADTISDNGPAIHVTNAGAGAATFAGSDSRSFNYFTPKGRNSSVYEDVTVDVQPDPGRYLLQGWLYAFADGTEGYDPRWTKMKSSDWHVFRDPKEQWHRTFYIREAKTVRQIPQTQAMARSEKFYAAWLHEDIKLRNYVKKKLHSAGISRIEIERAANKVKISIHTPRPGIVIGKKGAGIEGLKKELQGLSNSEIFVNIHEVRKAEIDAQLVAENVAMQVSGPGDSTGTPLLPSRATKARKAATHSPANNLWAALTCPSACTCMCRICHLTSHACL